MREEIKFSDEGPAQEQKQICMSQATFVSLRPSQRSELQGGISGAVSTWQEQLYQSWWIS